MTRYLIVWAAFVATTSYAFVTRIDSTFSSMRLHSSPQSQPDGRSAVSYNALNNMPPPLPPGFAPPGGELARPPQQQPWQPPQEQQVWQQQAPPQRAGPLNPDDNWRRPLQVDNYQYRTVQGNSRKTFNTMGGRNEVEFSTDGRELYTDMEVWQGPDNTPQTMKWYAQDGNHRIRATVTSTQYHSIETRNRGTLEFPMNVQMQPQAPGSPTKQQHQPFHGTNSVPAVEFRPIPSHEDRMAKRDPSRGTTIQGDGSVKTYPIDPYTSSVQVLLDGQGFPVYARIELLQGPDCVKILGELYNDGLQNGGEPVRTVLETPGYGSTLRVVNTGPMEYPIICTVAPASYGEPVNNYQQQQSVFDSNGRYIGY
ncbi:hypothetical protein FisN_7Lh399 [Fistulifera solaris]|uniref:Uncharacterized protein n=1 Tax=Fistulifera solaris TaxID=1519565 RepID=A0A1Z5JBL4_FISSO|nr:hypothetical protein FisN_7Lh399 [Fistulifera solaris]|eukprot:GAX11292.1 hypothetical protein FisN_7Lh399 [Fistulifera solaris]